MASMSVTHAYDLPEGGGILDGLEEGMSYIGTRDLEAEAGEVACSDAIFSGEWLVGKLRGAHDGPVEAALHNDLLHCGGIDDYAGKEKATEEIGWRHDGILEQESS